MQEMNWNPEDGRVEGVGSFQEATPHRQAQAATALEALVEYHAKAHTHLWLVILTHKASPQMLNAIDGGTDQEDGPAVLDVESMLGQPAIGCYLCEAAYSSRLRHRKCPGEATGL